MDCRTLFAIGFIILSSGYFIRSLQPAQAQANGPNINFAGNPYKSFYGYTNNTTTISLDGNQDFIITTMMSNYDGCQLRIDGVDLVYTGSNDYNPLWYRGVYGGGSAFASGNAHLVIPAGSTLEVSTCSSWYLDGYYVKP